MYLLKPNRKKVSRRGESQADRQTKEDYESMSSKTHKNISEKINKQWVCQGLAQQRYFPLCAQLYLWDGEQYAPLFSQTLTQVGEFSVSMLSCFKNNTG